MGSVRRDRGWPVLLVAALGGCTGEEGEETQAAEAPLVAEGEPVGAVSERCAESQLQEPSVSVQLAAADRGRVDVEAAPGGRLEMAVTNTSDEDASVTVESRFWSDGGKGHAAVSIGQVDGHSSTTSAVDPAVLGLPAGAFDTSGSLMVRAVAEYPQAGRVVSRSVPLAFHPVDGGWRIYDVVTRESTYAGGALSEDARARREAALSRAALGVRVGVVGRGTFVGSSDSPDWRPAEDGPADPDRGGAP